MIINLFKDYCENSTIHALHHIVAPRRHILERLFWVSVIGLAVLFASSLIAASYNRYQTDPTVIALEHNFRDWHTALPGTTLCFLNKYNESSGKEVIKKIWNASNGENYEYYNRFLSCLANANFNNLPLCLPFVKDTSLAKINISKIILQINYGFVRYKGGIFEPDEPVVFHETLSEMGLCYSYNSLITPYFYLGEKPGNMSQNPNPPMCDIFQILCYGKIIDINRGIQFYTHSPFDIPQATGGVVSEITTETIAGFEALATVASSKVRTLRPKQRKCIFFDEKKSGEGEAPFYTYNLCVKNCRRNLALKLCGCVPFFYMKRDKEIQCGIGDVLCLEEHSKFLETLVDVNTRKKHKCNCLPECTSVAYYQTDHSTVAIKNPGIYDYNSTLYRWGLNRLPRTQLRRDILFSAEDLLVAWGGIAGFFVGCSLISGIEIIYYFTIKLIRCIWCSKRKNSKKRRHRLIANNKLKVAWYEMDVKTNQGDLGPQYITAIIVNILSFAYGIAIGWTAPMQPLLQAPVTNETSFWDTSVQGLSDEAISWIGGVPCIGGFLATPIFGYLANAMGRKKTLVVSAVPFLVSFILKIIATDVMYLYISRTLSGIGGAGVLCVVPMYTGEIAENSIRGIISAFFNLFVCFGILSGFIIGSFTSYSMLAIVGLGTTIAFLILFLWCPESPVYSLMNNRSDDAYNALKKLRGNNQEVIQNQMNIISTSVNEMSSNANSGSILEMIHDLPTRKALVITLVTLTVQQASGIAPIVNYTVSIFEASGSQMSPTIAAIIVGSLQTLGATFATILMDKAGRKMLLILSCIFMAVTQSAIAYFLYLKNSGADEDTLASIGWLPVTSLALYVVSYGLGIGPVSYVLISELFKAKFRSAATSICMLHLWFLSFVFLKFFSNVIAALGIETCFAFFAGCCVFGAIFTYFCLIETKGKPLETILYELGDTPHPDSRASPTPFIDSDMIIKSKI